MKSIEYFKWYLHDKVTGKRRLSRWKMPRVAALERDPTAEPDLATMEVRDLPETDEERMTALYCSRAGVGGCSAETATATRRGPAGGEPGPI
ncbi:MAG: hypothetical protein U1E60_31510 [Reyranellaceae bacterium]